MFEEYIPTLLKGVAVGVVRGLYGFGKHKKEDSDEAFNLGKYLKSVAIAAGLGVVAEVVVGFLPIGDSNVVVEGLIGLISQYVAPWIGTDVVEDIFLNK